MGSSGYSFKSVGQKEGSINVVLQMTAESSEGHGTPRKGWGNLLLAG